jgi:hypothetical protein
MPITKWKIEGECNACGQPIEGHYYREDDKLYEETHPPARWESRDENGGVLIVPCDCGGELRVELAHALPPP